MASRSRPSDPSAKSRPGSSDSGSATRHPRRQTSQIGPTSPSPSADRTTLGGPVASSRGRGLGEVTRFRRFPPGTCRPEFGICRCRFRFRPEMIVLALVAMFGTLSHTATSRNSSARVGSKSVTARSTGACNAVNECRCRASNGSSRAENFAMIADQLQVRDDREHHRHNLDQFVRVEIDGALRMSGR